MCPRTPISTLFPYTTLFRSHVPDHQRCSGQPLAAQWFWYRFRTLHCEKVQAEPLYRHAWFAWHGEYGRGFSDPPLTDFAAAPTHSEHHSSPPTVCEVHGWRVSQTISLDQCDAQALTETG